MSDATQKGVEEQNAGMSAHNQERLRMINAIAGDEEPEKKELTEEIHDEIEPEEVAEIEEAEEVESTDEIDEEPQKISLKDKIKLKIDGEEQDADYEKIIEAGKKALQKELAADRRLEEATRLLREAQSQSQPSSDAAQPLPQDAEIDLEEIVRAIQIGNETEGAEALKKLLGRSQATPQVDQSQINETVTQAIEMREIQARLTQEYSEIVNDPDHRLLAANKVQALLDAGEPATWETYEKVCKDLSQKYGLKKVDNTLDEKREKKRAVTAIPSASAKTPVKPEEKPQTTRDVIKEMAAARHQVI